MARLDKVLSSLQVALYGGLFFYAFSEFARGGSNCVFENAVKKFDIVIARTFGNFGNRQIGFAKQAASLFNTAILQIFRKGAVHITSETCTCVGKAEVSVPTQFAQ